MGRPKKTLKGVRAVRLKIRVGAVALACLLLGAVATPIVAPSAAPAKGSSCSKPFKDTARSLWGGSIRGDQKSRIRLRLIHQNPAMLIRWQWKPRSGYVVCKAVLRLYQRPAYIDRRPRGGSYEYRYSSGASRALVREVTVYTRRQLR